MTSERRGNVPRIRLHEPIDPRAYGSPTALLQALVGIHEDAVLRWPEATDLPLSRWKLAAEHDDRTTARAGLRP
jgi:hypothetical protein